MTYIKNKTVYKRTSVYKNKKEPKEIFKKIAEKIGNDPWRKGECLKHIDIGGASGDFAGYLKENNKNYQVYCCDYDMELIKKGRVFYPDVFFLRADANNLNFIKEDIFNSVTMTGVMTVFDDFEPSLNECLRICKKGGKVIVTGLFNDYPVDALVKWRYSGDKGAYNRGYNLFSKKSISDFLSNHEKVKTWTFEKFHLPFDLEKQEDPIRTWTEIDLKGNRVFKNGLQMEINIQFLEISL